MRGDLAFARSSLSHEDRQRVWVVNYSGKSLTVSKITNPGAWIGLIVAAEDQNQVNPLTIMLARPNTTVKTAPKSCRKSPLMTE